jgi:hypothetical protein
VYFLEVATFFFVRYLLRKWLFSSLGSRRAEGGAGRGEVAN